MYKFEHSELHASVLQNMSYSHFPNVSHDVALPPFFKLAEILISPSLIPHVSDFFLKCPLIRSVLLGVTEPRKSFHHFPQMTCSLFSQVFHTFLPHQIL